jgi:tetratricopeptide (TPR) repeat protein
MSICCCFSTKERESSPLISAPSTARKPQGQNTLSISPASEGTTTTKTKKAMDKHRSTTLTNPSAPATSAPSASSSSSSSSTATTSKTQRVLAQLGPALQTEPKPAATANQPPDDESVDSTSQILVLNGGYLAREGKHEEALPLLQQALKMRIERFGEYGKKNLRSLPFEISCYQLIMESLCELGKPDEGMIYVQKLLEARIILYGTENHESIARNISTLGYARLVHGENEKALEYFMRAAKIHAIIYGEEHPSIADCFKYIGLALTGLKRFKEAWDYLHKSLVMRIKIHGKEHEATKETREAIAEFDEALVQAPDFEVRFDEILQLHINKYGKIHFETAKFYAMIGGLLLEEGKKPLGLSYLQKGLALLDAEKGSQS